MHYSNYSSLDSHDKVDILVSLRDAGLDVLVYEVLQLLSVREVCSAVQVSKSWADWDNSYLWTRRLTSQLTARPELRSVLAGLDETEEPKLCLLRLERLKDSWRQSECRTVRLREESSVLSLAISLTHTSLICGLNCGDVAQYNIKTGQLERSKEMHNKGVRAVLETSGGVLYTGSYDGTVKVWAPDWSNLTVIPLSVAITDIVVEAGWLYVCGDTGSLVCFTREEEEEEGHGLRRVWAVAGGEMINCLVVWSDWLVSGSDTGQLELRSPHTGTVQHSLLGHDRGCGISALAVSPLGLWSASFDCKILLWSQARPGEALCVLRGHTNPVRCLALDTSRLVSGDYRGFVMIWDMADIRDELATFHRRKQKPSKVSQRPPVSDIYRLEGRQVVKTSGGEMAEVVQHNSLLEHRGNVTAVRLSGPDILVTASRDKSLNIHRFLTSSQQHNKYQRKSYF